MQPCRLHQISTPVSRWRLQGKNVVTEASRALTKAMWAAGPHVLSVRQKAEFALDFVRRRVLRDTSAPPFSPTFSGVVQHFLLHAGALMKNNQRLPVRATYSSVCWTSAPDVCDLRPRT